MSNAPNQLSFLPDDYLARKAQRRSNALCASLFLVVMVGMGSAFVFTERSLRATESEHAKIEKQFTEAAIRIKQVQQMQEKQKRMAYQADLIASLLEKVPRSYLVAEVTNALPVGVSLLDFALDSKVKSVAQGEKNRNAFEQRKVAAKKDKNAPPEPPQPKPKALDVTMRVTGVAETDVQVAQLINKLSRSRVFKDVNLIISDEYTPVSDKDKLAMEAKMRRFVIELTLDPTANVLPDESKVVTTAVELKPE